MDKYYNYKNIFYKYKYNHDDNFTSSYILTMQTCEYNNVDYDGIFDINENSKNNIIVLDNFYEDPYKVRNFALSQNINITGGFPGHRSESYTIDYIKDKLEHIIGEKIYNFFVNDDNSIQTLYNGNFFYTTEKDQPSIRQDFPYDWVCIIYLTPDAPYDSGLNLYKQECIHNVPTYNIVDEFGNVFNRSLIFDAKEFHGSNKYFGKDKYDGQLFQVFWFSTHTNIFENQFENIFKINHNMNNEFIIIDNFYEDPYKVREFALNQEYFENYLLPGISTKSFVDKKIKDCLQKILEPFGEEIDKFEMTEYGKNCNFRLVTEQNNKGRYIHIDENNRSGIIFLNPNDCHTSGTSFYLYKNNIENETLIEKTEEQYEKIRRTNSGYDIFEMEKYFYQNNDNWKVIDNIGNVFNRLIIFNSKRFHQPNHYFGNNKTDGRLTQTFFFNTKKKDKIFTINKNIKSDIIIVNDFYKHPEKVREFVIHCNFTTVGNFPGLRTKSFATSKIKDKFERIIGKKIIDFPQGETDINNYTTYNGSFQYTLSNHKSWIHVDNYNNWAGVLYLTPDAPLNSGTKFYEFNDKSITDLNEKNKYSQDFSKWTLVDRVGNVFNRLLLFNSKRFHISDEYFGNNIYNSRLFQVFFFTSE